MDEKAKKLDEENAKQVDQIRELNQKNRAIEKDKFDEGKLQLRDISLSQFFLIFHFLEILSE